MSAEDSEAMVDEEEDEEDEEDDDDEEEDDEDEAKPRKKRAPAKSPPKSPRKSPPRKGGRKAAAPGASNTTAGASARSVASRGLPQGALAVGVGGFEVRSLDGVPPLLTPEAMRTALKYISAGQHRQASLALGMGEVDSIRAFCKAACRALGLSVPAGTSLEGGSALSPSAQARLQQGLEPLDSDLPGRLLVVRAGTAVSDETGEPLCPLSAVDRVFSSAAELRAITATPLATCARRSP